MPLADILAALDREADEAVARIEAEADAEIEGIRARAREEARSIERAAVEAGRTRGARAAERAERAAEADAARHLDAVRASLADDALAALRDDLAGLRGSPEHAAVHDALVREALAALPEARVARIDARDAARSDALRAAGLEIDVSLETAGGVVLETDDGRALRDTLEDRLAESEPALRRHLARALAALEADLDDD